MMKAYDGQLVTIKGTFETETHGIPYITNIEVIKASDTEQEAESGPDGKMEYKYFCYHAEYIIDEFTSGSCNAESEQIVLQMINSSGGELVGKVEYYERYFDRYMGEYFEDDSGLTLFLSN